MLSYIIVSSLLPAEEGSSGNNKTMSGASVLSFIINLYTVNHSPLPLSPKKVLLWVSKKKIKNPNFTVKL